MSDGSPLTRDERKDLLLSVGSHRRTRRLSPVEVAHLIRQALDRGMSREELSDLLSIGSTQIGEFLKLLDLSDEVRDMAGWGGRTGQIGTIPFSSLTQLRRLDAAEQRSVAEAILRYDLTWKEIVALMQVKRRSNRTAAECIENALALRPLVEQRHVFIGAIADDELVRYLESLNQSGRDELLRQACSLVGLDPVLLDVRLGARTVVIVTDTDAASALGQKPDDLEDNVVASLRQISGRTG